MAQNLMHGPCTTGTTIKRKAAAEFTLDMAETLMSHFQRYSVDGIVTIEVTNHGLWLVVPSSGHRQFLGLARFEREHGTPQ